MVDESVKERLLGELLAVPEERLFDEGAEFSSLAWEASEHDFEGILIAAPAFIDVDRRSAMPILMLHRASGARCDEVVPFKNLTLVASPLDGGPALSAPMFAETKTLAKPRKPRAEKAGKRPVARTSVQSVDVRERLEVPWASGRYAIRVIALDWVSNPAVVELRSGAAPRAAAGGAIGAVSQAPRREGASASLTRFRRGPETPSLEGQGVALAAPPEVAAAAPRIVLHGSLRMALEPSAIVARSAAEGEAIAAVLSASLVFARLDVSNPRRLDLEIPVVADRALAPGEVAEGFFSIDLNAELPSPLDPDVYHVYLLAGAHVAGPHRMILAAPMEAQEAGG